MHDVGILRTTIGIESLTRRGRVLELPDVMVDTGSEYTSVPRRILDELDIPVERVGRLRADLKTKQLVPAGPAPAAAA